MIETSPRRWRVARPLDNESDRSGGGETPEITGLRKPVQRVWRRFEKSLGPRQVELAPARSRERRRQALAGRPKSRDQQASLRPRRRTRIHAKRNSALIGNRGRTTDDAARLEIRDEQGTRLLQRDTCMPLARSSARVSSAEWSAS
jgi:hypothetical protein